MRASLIILLLFLKQFSCFSQDILSEIGLRQFQIEYKQDVVDFVVKSKVGEENLKKPIFLFCQGSLPRPLGTLKIDGAISGFYGFPFSIPDSLIRYFHIAVISKPGVPIMAYADSLGRNFTYLDPKTQQVPAYFNEREYPKYHVDRNLHVVNFLQSKDWVGGNQLVVAGHSQGSMIAAQMAAKSEKVTHLIFSGGNPFGRIMQMISLNRRHESDSLPQVERTFQYWKKVVANKNSLKASTGGDSDKATFDFSENILDDLLKLEIPVLVTYGSKDRGALFNDYLKVETIRQDKNNYEFRSYIGLEHNFFPMNADGTINHDIFNWDNVAQDWTNWIIEN